MPPQCGLFTHTGPFPWPCDPRRGHTSGSHPKAWCWSERRTDIWQWKRGQSLQPGPLSSSADASRRGLKREGKKRKQVEARLTGGWSSWLQAPTGHNGSCPSAGALAPDGVTVRWAGRPATGGPRAATAVTPLTSCYRRPMSCCLLMACSTATITPSTSHFGPPLPVPGLHPAQQSPPGLLLRWAPSPAPHLETAMCVLSC